MYTLIEFHGRLSRSDKRPANPGRYDLLFQLHASVDGSAAIWSENVRGVDVAPGGFYYVALGQKAPLVANLFSGGPRWLSVRVIVGGKRSDEHSSRVPLLGQIVSLGEVTQQLEARVAQIENTLSNLGSPRGLRREQGPTNLRDWAADMSERLSGLEDRGGGLNGDTLNRLHLRLEAIDGEEGRLTRIEDEMEDIVGPDGDIVDLNERMELLEAQGPDLITSLRQRESETGRERINQMDDAIRALNDRFTEIDRTLVELRAALQTLREEPPPSPEAIGAVKKGGDTMSGPLTIQKGGLTLASGGLTARSAEIASLEASSVVKTARIVTEAVELKGDLVTDNAKRFVQVRHVEGRHGSGKRDGPLHLNARGGGEVIVGNAEQRLGMQVHGPTSADSTVLGAGPLAVALEAVGKPRSGDVVVLDGGRVAACSQAGDPRVAGVVVSAPALLLGGAAGDGRVAVAIGGVTACRVDAGSAPIRPGDRLVCGTTTGHARSADGLELVAGAILGKALEGLESGQATIQVLLMPR